MTESLHVPIDPEPRILAAPQVQDWCIDGLPLDEVIRMTPMKRYGQPDEIAGAAGDADGLAAVGIRGAPNQTLTGMLVWSGIFGLGSGGIYGGVNALYLDLFASARGRALNLLHLFFSLGAVGAERAADSTV